LQSGVFRCYGPPPVCKKKEISIKDWTIAFKVNLNFQTLDNQHVPEHVKAKLKNLDDYTIKQLVVDFTSMFLSIYMVVITNFSQRRKFHNTTRIKPSSTRHSK
jgi:hypothetical protein